MAAIKCITIRRSIINITYLCNFSSLKRNSAACPSVDFSMSARAFFSSAKSPRRWSIAVSKSDIRNFVWHAMKRQKQKQWVWRKQKREREREREREEERKRISAISPYKIKVWNPVWNQHVVYVPFLARMALSSAISLSAVSAALFISFAAAAARDPGTKPVESGCSSTSIRAIASLADFSSYNKNVLKQWKSVIIWN